MLGGISLRKAKKRGFNNKKSNRKDKHFVGRQIRSSEVMCIDDQNVNRGVISIQDALRLADTSGLDLVQVSPSGRDNAPTCRIIDYSKFKYELTKKEKASNKKQRENAIKVKEVKFRPVTDDNDLRIKARQVQGFVDAGHRVKVTITMRGREMSHKEVSFDTFKKFVGMLEGADVVSEPSMAGRSMCAMLAKAQPEKALSA
jgi:translation initiation factor IF-3